LGLSTSTVVGSVISSLLSTTIYARYHYDRLELEGREGKPLASLHLIIMTAYPLEHTTSNGRLKIVGHFMGMMMVYKSSYWARLGSV